MIKLIGNIYWYTVEFGLCKENNEMKFFGGGIPSSLEELKNVKECGNYKKLDLSKEFPMEKLEVNNLQSFFYYIEKFSDLEC